MGSPEIGIFIDRNLHLMIFVIGKHGNYMLSRADVSFLDPVFVVVQGARGIHIPLPFDRFGQDHVFYAFFF